MKFRHTVKVLIGLGVLSGGALFADDWWDQNGPTIIAGIQQQLGSALGTIQGPGDLTRSPVCDSGKFLDFRKNAILAGGYCADYKVQVKKAFTEMADKYITDIQKTVDPPGKCQYTPARPATVGLVQSECKGTFEYILDSPVIRLPDDHLGKYAITASIVSEMKDLRDNIATQLDRGLLYLGDPATTRCDAYVQVYRANAKKAKEVVDVFANAENNQGIRTTCDWNDPTQAQNAKTGIFLHELCENIKEHRYNKDAE
jgi:hypothetical protein